MTAETFHLLITFPGIREVTDEQREAVRARITRSCVSCGRYGECWNLRGVFVCSNRALHGSCDPINEDEEE